MTRRLAAYVVVALMLVAMPTVAHAYNYSGYHWLTPTAYFNDTEYPFSAPFQTAIRQAASTWNSSESYFQFLRDTENSNYWFADDLGTGSTLAITGWNADGWIIYECVTVFNDQKPWQTNGSPYCYDVETVALHEFGHWLCLGHVLSPSTAVMYPYISLGQVKRSLHSDDDAGICFIYGPQP